MNEKSHCDAVINGIYYLQKCQLILKHFKDPHVGVWLNELDETQKIFELNQTHHPLLEESMHFINDKIIHPFLNTLEAMKHLENHYLEINYVIRRLQLIREFMPNISQVPLDDVFCQQYQQEYIQLDDPLVIEKQLANFNDYISVGCAYAKLGNMIKLPVFSMVFQNLGGAFLLANIQKARQIKLREMTNPTLDFISNLWSIQDKAPVLKNFMKCSMTKINSHHKIYIPYLFKPTFTLEKINQEIQDGQLYKMEDFEGFSLIEENLFENATQSLFIKDRLNRIKVRVLSANKNVFKATDQHGLVKQISIISKEHHHIFCASEASNQKITKVILQIHGGGWIGMSSFSHQTYTRKWANHIGDDCVIFSVDYRLAPKYPYPYALEDVWQLYLWIVLICVQLSFISVNFS